MKTYTVVIERCPETGFYVGSVPGFPGAHSQGESLNELRANMQEVIAMLLEDGELACESDDRPARSNETGRRHYGGPA